MGQTLENGVYLPSEGERNCYAGLKTNWEILDQKVADVTALQQAVAGALHREIVESLPTTDIDPNTIYMILSGTSATENVYNEFMYVNNAWELIGTSATDLTNYYTKAEVDGKLLLKANASDLTSHTGDTTIHVTTADKTKWNNQTYVFRYSSTVLVASSTNSNTLLDNTDNLKVGDKVIDSDGVLFSVTAIDTVNSTFTVGSALVDLALDANVVHTSGNETVGGSKTFSDTATFSSVNIDDVRWKNLTNQTVDLNDCYVAKPGVISGYYVASASSGANISNRPTNTAFVLLSITTRRISVSDYQVIQKYYSSDGEYSRNCSNGTWSNWVKDTDKFVTTDTDQTVTSIKSFTGLRTEFKRSNNDGVLLFSNGTFSKGDTPLNVTQISRNYYGDGTSVASSIGYSSFSIQNNGNKTVYQLYSIANTAGSSLRTDFTLNYDKSLSGTDAQYATFGGNVLPDVTSTYNLGDSTNKWKTINGLEPSALGMPDLSNGIDISSYIPALDSSGNTQGSYTPNVNGFIAFRGIGYGCSIVQGNMGNNASYVADPQTSNRIVNNFLPLVKDNPVVITARGLTSIEFIYFYPCQGNV